MKKSIGSIDGLNCGAVIYDEVEQNLRETLEVMQKQDKNFFAPIINGMGNDIQLIGGIDFSSGEDWSAEVTIRNPRLLNKEEKRK